MFDLEALFPATEWDPLLPVPELDDEGDPPPELECEPPELPLGVPELEPPEPPELE